MSVLFLDPAKIKTLKEYANQHRYSFAVIEKIIKGEAQLPGFGDKYSIELLIGYNVAYTIEEHKGGLFHHLSVSINRLNFMPDLIACESLMKEFGFTHDLNDCIVYLTPDQNPPIVNIVEPLPPEE